MKQSEGILLLVVYRWFGGVWCAIIDGYQSVENEVKSEVNGRVVVIVVICN